MEKRVAPARSEHLVTVGPALEEREARRLSFAVIVPTLGRPEELRRCIAGLASQTKAPDRVVVVRRADDVETAAALRELPPNVVSLDEAVVMSPGVIAAMDEGVSRCAEDVVVLVDDDAVPRPDWLQRLAAHYTEDVGGVGGRDVLASVGEAPGGKLDALRVGELTWYGRLVGNHHLGAGDARDVDVLKGVNLSLRRSLWKLDTHLRGEGAQVHWEVGMSIAARRKGWRLVYDPNAVVDHRPARRFDDDARDVPTMRASTNASYNLVYSIAAHAPLAHVLASGLYLLAVGTRKEPGVVALCETIARKPSRAGSQVRLFIMATGARVAGLAAGLQARRR